MLSTRRFAACTAVILTLSMPAGLSASAAENFSIDMTDNNDAAWADVAMANDDTVETGVTIRSGKSTDSRPVGYLYRGGAVRVVDKRDGWTEVESGGVHGFIKDDYLTYGTDSKGLAEYYGKYGVKASWNDVNVFASNNSAAKIVATADADDTYLYIGNDGHFIEVQNGADSTAYVSSEDVTPVILVDNAVSIDQATANVGANGVSVQDAAAPAAETAPEAAPADTASDNTAYTESAADTFSEDGCAEQTYEDTSAEQVYTDTAQTYTDTDEEYYDDSAETYTDETSAETYDASAEEIYEDTSASQPADYSFDASGYSSAAAAAQGAYQVYLNAQADADAAAADGTDADRINSTAAAAQAAYKTYLTYQNAADNEAAGVSANTSSSDAQNAGQTYSEEQTYTETEAPQTEAPETEAPQTEAPETETSAADADSSDIDLLAAIIYCEAGNQPYDGKVAVGAVVMNRVASASFPGSISDVVYQSGQFTPAYTGVLANALASGVPSECYSAAYDALAGSDPTGGCLYFNTSHGSGVHIGAHWFY